MRVCLDARATEAMGGVQQVLIGLAHGLSSLSDGDEEYFFLAYRGQESWIRPYLGGRCRLLLLPHPPAPPRRRGAVAAVRRALGAVLPTGLLPPYRAPRSDGTIEREGVDVMHFTFQEAFLTEVPSIYHPHDLQHVYFPRFFTARERRDREIAYRTFCRRSRMVAVANRWMQRDVARHYGLTDEQVRVIPLAPPLAVYPTPSDENLAAVRSAYRLPEAFLLYPAQTWAHKNHLGLLDALALLRRRRGLVTPLVCCGRQNGFFPVIARHVRALHLEDQVRFVGFVSPLELQCLYRLSRAVVVPTKFEAGSFPMWEAFLAGVPVASSTVTSLPEQAGDAALLFDPDRPEEIAEAVARLWTDAELRGTLAARGRERVGRFTWDRTARIFRAHYRRIAGRPFTGEDVELLRGS